MTRAKVQGDVTSDGTITLMNGSSITGASTPNAGLTFGARELFSVGFPVESLEPMMQEPGTTLSLEPGRYGALHIKPRATVTLRAGTYYFDELFIEPGAILNLTEPEAPTAIAVAGTLTYRARPTGKGANSVIIGALFRLPRLELPEPTFVTSAGPPPSLDASEASVNSFTEWLALSTPSDLEGARAAVAAHRGDGAIAATVIARHQAIRESQPSRAQLLLSLLGELRAEVGAEYMLGLVWEPMPAGGEYVPEYGYPERNVALMRAFKAVHGVAYMNTLDMNQSLLEIVATHPEAAVRAEAVRAYQYEQGGAARAKLLATVPTDEEYLVDRFESRRRIPEEPDFDAALATYLAAHADQYE